MSRAPAYSVAEPTPGFYRTHLVKGGPKVGIRIWFGAPLDPVTGEELDRSHRWQATANGEYIDLDRVWPACGRDPINQAEHDFLTESHRWAAQHAPNSVHANPRRRIDLLDAPVAI